MFSLLLQTASALVLTKEMITERGQAKTLWKDFKLQFKRHYASDQEEQFRFGVFVKNLARAAELNEADTASHGITKFMDLTPAEFKSQFLNFVPQIQPETEWTKPKDRNLAQVSCSSTTDCNWASLGAVTPVKDQGQCGSCWAFSTTEGVESAWFLGGNKLPTLAPQQLVDCDSSDNGCNGGDLPTAFDYVVSAGGLESEVNYPYQAKNGHCNFTSSLVTASITGASFTIPPCNTFATHNCNNQDEASLWTDIQTQGPASICVDAEPWQFYQGGIFNNANCQHGYYALDHCVQLTGYGTDNGEKYWLVRNSWGTSWGESGYIRLSYGNNMCGVADEVMMAAATTSN